MSFSSFELEASLERPLTYAELKAAYPDFEYDLNILNASYDDLDADGLYDDIWIFGSIELFGIDEFPVYHALISHIITPSGIQFSESFDIWLSENSTLFYIHAYNTAIEPGYYYASLFGFVIAEQYLLFGYDGLIFDPPGEKNADPSLFEFIPYDYFNSTI